MADAKSELPGSSGRALTGAGATAALRPIAPEHFAGIFDAAMDAIVSVDSHQRIVLFNAAAEKMFRCPASQAIGQSLDIFIPAALREAHRRHHARFRDEGITARAMGNLQPLAAVRADGEEFPIEASIAMSGRDGDKLFTAIVRDVGPRLRAEQSLQEAQARFRTIFENAALGIALTDTRGILLEVNAALEAMLGFADAELRGMDFAQITHPGDMKATLESRQALASGAVQRYELEKRYLAKEGKRVWVREVSSAIRNGKGEVRFLVKMIEDITARKAREQRHRRKLAERMEWQRKLDTLTPREKEVLWMVVDGEPTKIIAVILGLSPKTVEVHRARLMHKMQVNSVAKLVQEVLPLRAGVKPPRKPEARQEPAGGGRRNKSAR